MCLTFRRDARWRPCRLNARPLEDATGWLDGYRQYWEASFDRLDEHLQTIQKGATTMSEQATETKTGPKLEITRVFDAPRELVWAAWTDPEQLAFAIAQGRVLFTQDEDFLSLASEVLEHPGIVHCRPNTRSIGAIISGLELIWEACASEEMKNQVSYI